MGMNWESATVVGFVIDKDDLEMPFKQTVPEEFHMEDRYNRRTGKKLNEQVKVVDKKEYEEFFFNGSSVGDDPSELVSCLESEVGCRISMYGNYCDAIDLVYAIEPIDAESDSFTFKQIAELEPECERIRKIFKERYGIDLGEPSIQTVMTYA